MNQAMKKKIAEIREALEKATPGPWFAVKVDPDSDGYSISNKPGYYGHAITGWGRVLQTKEDAHLIANTPEWLRWAIDEIERLGNLARQERELADHWMRKHHDDVVKLREERDNLQQAYDDAEMRASDAIAERNDAHEEIEQYKQFEQKYKQFEQQYAEFQKGWKQFQEEQAMLEELKQNLALKRKQKRQGL